MNRIRRSSVRKATTREKHHLFYSLCAQQASNPSDFDINWPADSTGTTKLKNGGHLKTYAAGCRELLDLHALSEMPWETSLRNVR